MFQLTLIFYLSFNLELIYNCNVVNDYPYNDRVEKVCVRQAEKLYGMHSSDYEALAVINPYFDWSN